MLTAAIIALIVAAILYLLALVLYYIEVALAKLIDLIYSMFGVFAGVDRITFNGDAGARITDIFLKNDLVQTIYMGMAVIGIAMIFGFAIAAVVKKIFDMSGEKMKATYGMIIMNTGKGILLMLLMTTIVTFTFQATSLLLTQIDDLFDNVEEINDPQTKVFTDEELATMFRVIDTISNHALDEGYDNRFNINSCYNEIRNDLQTLEASRVFEYSYDEFPTSWQYCIREIYLANDCSQDIYLDVTNDSVRESILRVIELVKIDKSFAPLQKYSRSYSKQGANADLGRVLMLSGTMNAAENDNYNGDNASVTDPIRKPFYLGTKNIYNLIDVERSFSIELWDWDHLLVIFVEIIVFIELIKMVFNCVARLFNIMVLYITAPGFIAVMPLDDGGKFKQWTTAFIVQSFSIFGMYISIRLLVLFIPIIMDGGVVLFSSGTANFVAKIFFVVGMCITASKSGAMIGGILADNAGYQSIMAGNAGDSGLGLLGQGAMLVGKGVAKGVGALASRGGGKDAKGKSASGNAAKGNEAKTPTPATKAQPQRTPAQKTPAQNTTETKTKGALTDNKAFDKKDLNQFGGDTQKEVEYMKNRTETKQNLNKGWNSQSESHFGQKTGQGFTLGSGSKLAKQLPNKK